MALKIEDYALIGDCQTAALVGRDGSIDWLGFPRFDSAACFAALLGTPEHGRWRVAPVEPPRSATRQYRSDTLVLETTFATDSGEVTLVDLMPVGTDQPHVVRLIIGRQGTVRMRTELAARFDYGSITPWVRQEADGRQGVRFTAGPETLHLRTDVPLRGEGWATVGEFDVAQGQTVPLVLTWHPSHLPGPPGLDPLGAAAETTRWWQAWAARCSFRGKWRSAVIRSLITLKALTYDPTGGIVAAATTSLPERIGGERNWDYRYCWLRDATFTLVALLRCGYTDEALAWRRWLLRAVAGRGDDLQIMYGVAGERRLPETEVGWLPGYENSRPVRIGNGAHHQFQLDVFGEVLDCLHLGRHYGLRESTDEWPIERELLNRLEQVWQEPDEGIWEIRGEKRFFTHSRLMAWVAFDRAIKDVQYHGMTGPVDRWRSLRDALHAEICQRGYSRRRGAFVQSYEGDELDASLLMMAELGFLPADDPRIVGTVAAIEQDLVRHGFVDRYRTESGVDGLAGGEGAFLLCTFWLADNYALMGRVEDAERLFENLLAIRNDVGLLAEEYDPVAGRQLGNFPQAFSHIGLINTARNLSERDAPAAVRPQA